MNSRRLFVTSARAYIIGFLMSLACISLVVPWFYPKTETIRSDTSNLPRKLGVESIFNTSSLARLVQKIIGEEASKNLLARFNKKNKAKLCQFPLEQGSSQLPTIYVITPTYRRREQLAELTRLGQTLMHVEKLVWLVIEEANTTTPIISEFLMRTGIEYAHLITGPMLKYSGKKPKGVLNRRAGIQWILQNAKEGVMYFADDDNTYAIDLFDERPEVRMVFEDNSQEDSFLRSLAPFEPKDIELRASNCTKILVWHTQTEENQPAAKIDRKKFHQTNLMELEKYLL